MRAMVLARAGVGVLEETERDIPVALPGEVLLKVRACGVCDTDVHLVGGELPLAEIPIVPGHEIVGTVEVLGDGVSNVSVGDRVGAPWLGYACEECECCRTGHENLCASARFTGCQLDGGYAEYAVVDARYVLKIPERYSDTEAAPLLCAGLLGYRAYRMAGPGKRVGLYGYGAAAHILTQVAAHEGRRVFAFTSPGDEAAQTFARESGAEWAGPSTDAPPEPLDVAIIFSSVGALVPVALRNVGPGGSVVCAGILMSDIPSVPYELLAGDRVLRSVTNLTREDARAFMSLADRVPLQPRVHTYALADANRALDDLRAGTVNGAAVLVP